MKKESHPSVADVLVIQPEALPLVPGFSRCRTLLYRFVEEPSPDGTFAWPLSDASSTHLIAVSSTCRRTDGSFRANALSRFLSRELLRQRPRWVLVRGVDGCALDLIRVADLFRVPVALELTTAPGDYPALTPWLTDCFRRLDVLCHDSSLPDQLASLVPSERRVSEGALADLMMNDPQAAATTSGGYAGGGPGLDYSIREFVQRDQPLIMQMQAADVRHFTGCQRVLDLGCGAGLFLQLLKEADIAATGVERNPKIAEYGRGMGLDIVTDDAVGYLERASGYDGIYCSHFVEHLPVELVEKLVSDAASALEPGGVLVLAFPDPESIRSQLLGFWRDPEHVRFYHPELLEGMALVHGLELEWSSHDHPRHEVVPFPLDAPAVPDMSGLGQSMEELEASWREVPVAADAWSRLLARLGLCSRRQFDLLQSDLSEKQQNMSKVISELRQAVAGLTDRTDQLWAVNRTWAWPDNAVLRFRKRPADESASQ